MNVNVRAIDFVAKSELNEFVQKKVLKLEQFSDSITSVDVVMKVVKPEVSNNKEVMIEVMVPKSKLVVTKTADSFEEAFDTAMDAMIRSIQKEKEKNRN